MEYQVQKAGIGSDQWTTVYRSPDASKARDIFERQLRLYAVGRFRLLDPDGQVLDEQRALFTPRAEPNQGERPA